MALEAPIVDRVLSEFRRADRTGHGVIERGLLEGVLQRLGMGHQEVAALLDGGRGCERGSAVAYGPWLEWVLEAKPIKRRGEAERRRFLTEVWAPFAEELRRFRADAYARHERGVAAHEVVPPHAVVADLAARCLQLTEQWHGRPNASAFYEAFMDVAQLDGHSGYRFETIAQSRSQDGVTRVLDMSARMRLYGQAQAKGAAPALIGLLPQAAGESPIDNLVLPGLMRRREALRLLVGHRVQQLFLRLVVAKQRRLLARLGCGRDEDEVRRRVGETMGHEAEQSVAIACLLSSGRVLESYGQLPAEGRDRAAEFLAAEICRQAAPEPEIDDELGEFLEHCRKHPGRSFRASPVQHKLMLLKGLACPALRLVFRSTLERFTQHKYFTMRWARTVPLQMLEGDKFVTLRGVGTSEWSRFRKNVFAYGESHGLGQGGGGCAELPGCRPGGLRYELGTLLCEDEAAKVPNHRATDIEKIIRECRLLNPEGGSADALAGEVLHDVGQNPVVASSIGQTQHTQVMRASVADFPLVAERGSPRWREDLGAWLDVVQVGESQDAFFLSARTREPDSQALLEFLVGFRAHFLRAFGSTVDFSAMCLPTADGEFVVYLAPVACLKKLSVEAGQGMGNLPVDFQNPETGVLASKLQLPVSSVDCSQGKGNVLAVTPEFFELALAGRPMLQRLYDLNRRPGARVVADAFLCRQ